MRLTPFRRRARFMALLASLLGLGAGGKGCKPETGVPAPVLVFRKCGIMPAPIPLSCRAIVGPDGKLLPGKTPDDLRLCVGDDLDAALTDDERLRAQFMPCADDPVPSPAPTR